MVGFGGILVEHASQPTWPYVSYAELKRRIRTTQKHLLSQDRLSISQSPHLDGLPLGSPRALDYTAAFVGRVERELRAVNERYERELRGVKGAIDGARTPAALTAALTALSELHRYVCVNALCALRIGSKFDRYVGGRTLSHSRARIARALGAQPFCAGLVAGLFGELEADIRLRLDVRLAREAGGSAPAAAAAERARAAAKPSAPPSGARVFAREPTEREIERILDTLGPHYFPAAAGAAERARALAEPGAGCAGSAPRSEAVRRCLALGSTYAVYASVMTCRRALSVAKKPLVDATGVRASALGALDTGMLVAYLAMQLLMSRAADALPLRPKAVIVLGAAGSAAVTAATGMQEGPRAMLPLWVANGLLQATLYPQICLVLNAWLPPRGRGRAMAVWNTAVPLASLLSAALSAGLLPRRGWRGAFEGPAVLAAAAAVLTALLLTPEPRDGAAPGAAARGAAPSAARAAARAPEAAPAGPRAASIRTRDDEEGEDAPGAAGASFARWPGATAWRGARRTPAPPATSAERASAERPAEAARPPPVWSLELVRAVGGAYLLLKPIRYMFLFWGHYYQHAVLALTPARLGAIELCATAGGMGGGVAAGVLADSVPLGTIYARAALGLCALLLAFPHVAPLGFAADAAVVTATSALIGVLDNLGSGLTGAAIVEANERSQRAHVSIAAVVAFVAALGSVGTIVQTQLVTRVMEARGWHAVFTLAAAQALGGALLLSTAHFPKPGGAGAERATAPQARAAAGRAAASGRPAEAPVLDKLKRQ